MTESRFGKVKEEKERSVISSGEVTLYNVKAPYSKSGFSIKGGLELDSEDDTVRCHECGKWFKHVGLHLRVHNMTGKEYKVAHGLKMDAALCSESVRLTRVRVAEKGLVPWAAKHKHFYRKLVKKLSKAKIGKNSINQNMEVLNTRRQCPEQQIADIKKLAETLGRTPRKNEMRESRISIKTLIWTFGSVDQAIKIAGLTPVVRGGMGKVGLLGREQVLIMLENYWREHGRRPTYSDQRRGKLPAQSVYKRLFKGGWKEAINLTAIRLTRKVA